MVPQLGRGKIIGGIVAAVNLLARAFDNARGPANDFAAALADGTADLEAYLGKMDRLEELHRRYPELAAELWEAIAAWHAVIGSGDEEATAEAVERITTLQDSIRDLREEKGYLEEATRGVDRAQLDAAINTAIMEGAIDDAAEAVSNLITAYQEAYDAALSSINAQLGLFDRMNFEASRNIEEMAATWGYQAADINQHNENLLFAIESDLLPGVVSSFQDINEAAHLNEVISSLQDAGARMEDGRIIMTEEAQEIVDSLNNSFEEQLTAREALAETMAGMQVDLEAGGAEIVQNFEAMVEGLDLSDESRANGIATIQGLIEGMQSQEGAVGNTVGAIADCILSRLKSALDMNSPSRAMMETGQDTIEGLIQGAESKQGDLASAYEGLGKSALQSMESASTPQAQSVGRSIGDTTVDGATSVNYSAIPDTITSAFDGGRGNVNASVDRIVSDIQQNFQKMKEQCDRLAQAMMTQVHTAITSKAMPIHSAMETVRIGTVNALTPLKTGLPNTTTEAMNGTYQALQSGGDRLIARARAIADAVAATMARALQVNSPSRVMIKLFGNVMDGIYVGMDRGEDPALKKAQSIAKKLATALEAAPRTVQDSLDLIPASKMERHVRRADFCHASRTGHLCQHEAPDPRPHPHDAGDSKHHRRNPNPRGQDGTERDDDRRLVGTGTDPTAPRAHHRIRDGRRISGPGEAGRAHDPAGQGHCRRRRSRYGGNLAGELPLRCDDRPVRQRHGRHRGGPESGRERGVAEGAGHRREHQRRADGRRHGLQNAGDCRHGLPIPPCAPGSSGRLLRWDRLYGAGVQHHKHSQRDRTHAHERVPDHPRDERHVAPDAAAIAIAKGGEHNGKQHHRQIRDRPRQHHL